MSITLLTNSDSNSSTGEGMIFIDDDGPPPPRKDYVSSFAPASHMVVDGFTGIFSDLKRKISKNPKTSIILFLIFIALIIVIIVLSSKGSKNNNDQKEVVDCVGSWEEVPNEQFGTCSSACGGGSIRKRYRVSQKAENGGRECPERDGVAKFFDCNTQPCESEEPVDCVGVWEEVPDDALFGTCSEECGGGYIIKKYRVLQEAKNGGASCWPNSDGETSLFTCNNQPCPEPVDCVGAWEQVADATCSETCGGGTIEEEYNISTEAENGGQSCPNSQGDRRNTKECNTQPCPVPVDCVGAWEEVADATCSESCGGGTIEEEYNISTQAQNGGQACQIADGTRRNTKTCNTQPCPVEVDCVGAWEEVADATCSETCGGGTIEEEYKISTQAQNGGQACPNNQGDTRNIKECNTQPCPVAVDCVGAWEEVADATCSVECGGGTIEEEYKISTQAQNGGQVCPNEDGDTRNTKECNTQECISSEWGPVYVPTTIEPGSACLEPDGDPNYEYQLEVFDSYTRIIKRNKSRTEPYVAKVYVSNTDNCPDDWIYNDKHCLTGQENNYQFAYSYGGHALKPTFDPQLCTSENIDDCLYVCYKSDGTPVRIGEHVSEMRNANGESLMDRLIEDIWCDKIKHEDFEDDILKHMTAGTNGLGEIRYVPGTQFPYRRQERVRPGDILFNRLDEWRGRSLSNKTNTHYNYALQIMHMLLVMRRDGAPKPARVKLDFRMTVEST
jgi:hypothetical protein